MMLKPFATKLKLGFTTLLLIFLTACSEPTSVLPPDPGEAGKATLEGIDSDRDGVRDDVQRYIHLTYPNDEPTIEILTDHARLLQESILETYDDAGLIALEQQALELTFCLAQWRPEDANEDKRTFLSAFFNTPERFSAEKAYMESLPTAIYEVDDSLLQNCSQEIQAESLVSSQAAGEREIIFFLNGVMNSYGQAFLSVDALLEGTGKPVKLLYNRTNGWYDFVETTAQKYNEPVQSWRDWIYGLDRRVDLLAHLAGLLSSAVTAGAQAEDLAKFRAQYETYRKQNYKIVIVSHSQGNLFANQLFNIISNDPKTPKKDGKVCGLDVVAVATPANRTVGSGFYSTVKNDLVITPIPSSLKSKDENPAEYKKQYEDGLHHGFLETYFRGTVTGPKIRNAIATAFSNMSFPEDCNKPPIAALTVTPTSGEAPLTVTANASASTDDGKIVNYTFNFGDGEPQTGARSSARHVYEEPGTYTVSVTVTDDGGKTDSAAETVEVLEGEYIGHFEYEYTAVHDNEVNWAGYECGTTNQITGTEKQRNDRKIISSATILFGSKMSGGELQLYALSVQGGSHTETSVGQNVTPTTTKNSNYSSNATGADFVPGGGSLYIRYTSSSFRQEFSTTNCGETDTTVTVGEPPSATQFRWDGSLSGSETEGEVVRDYCDTYGCYFFSYEEQFRWEITPK